MRLRQRKKNVRKYLVEKKKHYLGKGVQYIYHLPDGNRISVIKFEESKEWGKWGSCGADLDLYELDDMYQGEVYGYLTKKDVIKRLEWALKREVQYEKNR